jgi:vancomycin aglycone glucosyltransferase
MQIALVVDGTRGDVQPMLVLGQALAAEGHGIRLCAPPDFREATKRAGLEFRAVGTDVRAWLASHVHALDGRPIQALREMIHYARECLRAQFEALPEATSGSQYLIGAGVQLAGPSVAELRGIPYTYIAYCPALFPSAEHPSMVLPHQTLPGWANRLSWRATRTLLNRVFLGTLGERRAELGLPPVRDVLDYLVGERPALAADSELAPLPSDCAIPVRHIRAFQPSPGDPLPAKLDSFLQQGPPPVYVGFGSMTDSDSARTTREIAKALSGVGCRAIVSRGWAGLGGVALPEGMLEIGAVCHVRLFPRLAAVVHHGGAGTTTAAARAGIPQVVVPHFADQHYWGRRVELLGIGPPAIPKKRFSAQALEAALHSILENEIVAERASELASRLRARAVIDLEPVLGS